MLQATITSVVMFLLLSCPALLHAATGQNVNVDLTKLSIEELMNIEVSSAAKKEQRLGDVASALYVISQEDILRSGATSIPEVLRLVPGVQVAQVNANVWSITARGFNGRFANKLLVLIDGRSVYTPLFSGVFWDVQDTLLEDIERIEVIRGPAGTLWGANAVNGVINIITKKAKDTQGGLVSAGGGTEEQGFAAIRYGAKVGDDLQFRLFGKFFNRDDFFGGGSGKDSHDEWKVGRGGIRLDWQPVKSDAFTLLGDYYSGTVGEGVFVPSFSPPFNQLMQKDGPVSGGSLLARWNRMLSGGADLKLQMYYDRTHRTSPAHKESRDTFDLEFQHRFGLTERQEINWGVGYRLTSDNLDGSATVSFDVGRQTDHLFSGFVQDEITLVRERLRLTLGSKFEHNDYTGFEIQPNVRLLWTPDQKQTFWGAVSRAVRTPSRGESSIRISQAVFPAGISPCPAFPGIPCEAAIFGNREFGSESLLAYEIGYRAQPHPRVSVDVAAFYNVYKDLVTAEPGSPFLALAPVPRLVIPLSIANKMDGETHGIEAAGTWTVTDRWKLNLGYTFLKLHLHPDKSSRSVGPDAIERRSPQNQFHFRSYLDLPYNFKLDTAIYYVDSLPEGAIPAYTRLDLRLGWSPLKNLDFSIAGQNLFDRRHKEFGPDFLTNPTKIERSVYGKVTWRF